MWRDAVQYCAVFSICWHRILRAPTHLAFGWKSNVRTEVHWQRLGCLISDNHIGENFRVRVNIFRSRRNSIIAIVISYDITCGYDSGLSFGSSWWCYIWSYSMASSFRKFFRVSATSTLFGTQALTTSGMAWHAMALYDFPDPAQPIWSIQSQAVQSSRVLVDATAGHFDEVQ